MKLTVIGEFFYYVCLVIQHMKIDKHSADIIFKGIECPHCNEKYIFEVPYSLEVLSIKSQREDTSQECREYNNLVNEKFQQLRSDEITKEEFIEFVRSISIYTPPI